DLGAVVMWQDIPAGRPAHRTTAKAGGNPPDVASSTLTARQRIQVHARSDGKTDFHPAADCGQHSVCGYSASLLDTHLLGPRGHRAVLTAAQLDAAAPEQPPHTHCPADAAHPVCRRDPAGPAADVQ